MGKLYSLANGVSGIYSSKCFLHISNFVSLQKSGEINLKNYVMMLIKVLLAIIIIIIELLVTKILVINKNFMLDVKR